MTDKSALTRKRSRSPNVTRISARSVNLSHAVEIKIPAKKRSRSQSGEISDEYKRDLRYQIQRHHYRFPINLYLLYKSLDNSSNGHEIHEGIKNALSSFVRNTCHSKYKIIDQWSYLVDWHNIKCHIYYKLSRDHSPKDKIILITFHYLSGDMNGFEKFYGLIRYNLLKNHPIACFDMFKE
jgi:hypothetical protein